MLYLICKFHEFAIQPYYSGNRIHILKWSLIEVNTFKINTSLMYIRRITCNLKYPSILAIVDINFNFCVLPSRARLLDYELRSSISANNHRIAAALKVLGLKSNCPLQFNEGASNQATVATYSMYKWIVKCSMYIHQDGSVWPFDALACHPTRPRIHLPQLSQFPQSIHYRSCYTTRTRRTLALCYQW